MISRPSEAEYPPGYAGYIAAVPEADVLAVLEAQPEVIGRLARDLTPEQERHAYAPGKWTVRQVLGHLSDAERCFGFRAFCFGRLDQNPLPGFEEDEYVRQADFDRVPAEELAREFATVRAGNLAFLRRLESDRWQNRGTANGKLVSVRALGFTMAGHVRHHLRVLQERYGVSLSG